MPWRFREWLLLAVGLAALFGGSIAFAQARAPALCRMGYDKNTGQLELIFERDEFRIFYTLKGAHALSDRTDRNLNKIPDAVEDVAIQLTASRDIFSKIMGLRHPLQQPRYASASNIDVFLLRFSKGSGTAYDEIHNHTADRDGKGYCALRIDVGIDHPNSNITPAHELFHLYQYGYSMFKAPWFLEGGARWAQNALQSASVPAPALPSDQAQLERKLLAKKYAASEVWNRIGVLLDPAGRLHLSPDLREKTYLDGAVVVEDDVLHGAAFMKDLLEELDKASLEVSQKKGWDRYKWREADQKDPSHDADVARATLAAARRQVQKIGIKNAELEFFLRALEEYAP
ncbi:MAG: hypothetical protein LBE33_04850 [Zoogloeaceae bacterium]|nr:hypothetical protein [Zoogloeaceae bacterium]